MQVVNIAADAREASRKKGTKAVRNEGKIPCVLYGVNENVTFSTTHNAVKQLIYTPDFKLAEISLDGKTYRCIVKDIQFHPVSEAILHIDFLALHDNHPVKVEIPVRFKGSSPGVRLGGTLQRNLRRVKVKTTPEYLVDQLLLDISGMELGDAIRVRDIELQEGIEIMTAPGTPVASIEIPRALRSAATAAAKEAQAEGK